VNRRTFYILTALFILWIAVGFFVGGAPESCSELRFSAC
jgi:hypothetical protein